MHFLHATLYYCFISYLHYITCKVVTASMLEYRNSYYNPLYLPWKINFSSSIWSTTTAICIVHNYFRHSSFKFMIENVLLLLDSPMLLILPLASVCFFFKRLAVLIPMLVMQKFVELVVVKRNAYPWHVNYLQAHLLYFLMNPQQVIMHLQNLLWIELELCVWYSVSIWLIKQ